MNKNDSIKDRAICILIGFILGFITMVGVCISVADKDEKEKEEA